MTLDYVNARKAYLDRLRGMRRRERENLSSADFNLFSSRFDPLIEKVAAEVQRLGRAQQCEPVAPSAQPLADVNNFAKYIVVYVCTGQVSFGGHTTGNSGFGWEVPISGSEFTLSQGSNWCVGAQNSGVEKTHDLNSGKLYLNA